MANVNEGRLREVVSKILLINANDFDNGTSRKDLESWDSMAHLMLVTELESAFGITMSDDDVTGVKTFGDIKRVLRKLGVDL
jgi:acyl carrier protein